MIPAHVAVRKSIRNVVLKMRADLFNFKDEVSCNKYRLFFNISLVDRIMPGIIFRKEHDNLFLSGSFGGGRESIAEISLPRKMFVIKCSAPVLTEPVCHMIPTFLRNGNTMLAKVSSKPLFMTDFKIISLTALPLKESIAAINDLICVSYMTESNR